MTFTADPRVDANIDTLRAKKTTVIDLVRMTSGRRRYFVNVSAGGFSGVFLVGVDGYHLTGVNFAQPSRTQAGRPKRTS